MLIHNFWYYAVRLHKSEVDLRLGPFESEEDLIAYLRHEKLQGIFDIVRAVQLYTE